MSADDDKPVFDEALITKYVGQVMVVGLTYVDAKGEIEYREQLYGEIVSVSTSSGIELRLLGVNTGRTQWLPPDLRTTLIAEPGEYTLRETKEIVKDPALLGTWVIQSPRR